jgi:hypothetical protein
MRHLLSLVALAAVAGCSHKSDVVDWSKPHPIKNLPGYYVAKGNQFSGFDVVDAQGKRLPMPGGLMIYINTKTGAAESTPGTSPDYTQTIVGQVLPKR